MKKIAVMIMICVIAGMLPLAGGTWNKGFPVPSLHPLYTKADMVFLPELVGVWQEDGGDDTLIFEAAPRIGGYILTVEALDGKSFLEARLLRLGDELFLDLHTSDYFLDKAIEGEIYQPMLPVHAFGRVRIEGDVLRFSTLQSCIISCTDGELKTTETELGLPMEVIEHGGGLVLSATTEQLQEFVLQHLDQYFSFKEDEFLRRVSPPQEGESKKGEPDSAGGNQNEG